MTCRRLVHPRRAATRFASALLVGGLIATLTLTPSPVRAYTIGTGFSEGCHERITARAFGDIVQTLAEAPIELPEDDAWRSIGDFLIRSTGVDTSSYTDAQLYVLHSLLVGIRAPDTEGHAVLNLDNARALHTDPDASGQYAHSLRATTDDFQEGDESAVAGMRAAMREEFQEFQQSVSSGSFRRREQVYFDFYGIVNVDVWEPAYHLGRVAHALQDSFSHSVRHEGDGFQTIITVLNYAEAVTGTLRAERDGYAHSEVFDSCGEATAPIVAAATLATGELMQVAAAVASGTDDDALEGFLDRWVTLRTDCDETNDLCGNQRWLDLARSDPTEPFICTARGPSSPAPSRTSMGLFGLALGFFVAWRRTRPRGRS